MARKKTAAKGKQVTQVTQRRRVKFKIRETKPGEANWHGPMELDMASAMGQGFLYADTLDADQRHRQGSYYTPSGLCQPLVRRALEPLLACVEGDPWRMMALNVCDPACGGGAFLIHVIHQLGEEIRLALAAYRGELDDSCKDTAWCRRWVALHCAFGVDKDPGAAEMARKAVGEYVGVEPASLSHVIKCGDGLVGLLLPQLRALTWDPATEPDEDDPGTQFVDDLLRARRFDVLKQVGDYIVDGFFCCDKPGQRKKELARRQDVIRQWAAAVQETGSLGAPAEDMWERAAAFRKSHLPFHWPLEFPQVFIDKPFDPLVQRNPFVISQRESASNGVG